MSMPIPAARAVDNQSTPQTSLGPSTRAAILVIDDEANFCRVLEAKLTRCGFTVCTAPDVATGQRWLLARNFDLVLLDVRLPDANAINALPDLRSTAGNTPFLLMTAYEEENLRARALLSGAAEILYKPFDLEALIATVQRLLERGSRFSALQIGQAVVLKRTAGQDGSEVDARVARKSTDAFAVATGRPVDSKAGERVQVQLPGEDGVYEFHTTVVGFDQENRMVLAKPDVIHRHQRRQGTRVALAIPVAVRRASTGEVPPNAPMPEAIIASDISVAGLAVVAESPIPLHTPVALTFALPSDRPDVDSRIDASGEVVRSQRVTAGDTRVYRIVVRFDSLSDKAAASIQAYIASASSY